MGPARIIAVAALAATVSACAAPDEYPMSRQHAYEKLVAAKIVPGGNGPFFRLETDIRGNGLSEVTYDASGSMARHVCTMRLAALAEDRTKVAVTCEGGGAGDGAAGGMVHNMIRNRVIELVDATLKGRPFDPELAGGSTAYRWPDDGVDGSFVGAAAQAVKMDADMRRDIAEMENEAREARAAREAENPDPAMGMEPTAE